MSFYKNLASYYDRIFPLNQIALSFISQYFQEGEVVLDMGAGTGNMAIALAEKGLHVTASEPEETMAESIRHKSKLKELSVNVHTKTMEQIGEFQGSFDGIVCIGNTLPHLPINRGSRRLLASMLSKIKKGWGAHSSASKLRQSACKRGFCLSCHRKRRFPFYETLSKK